MNYTLDLNSGLTQVLNDGTNTYLYGLGRIAQVNTTTLVTDYFMTDALGSVRQLTDAQGDITVANAYEPYGVLAQTAGSAQTSYGFTGEFTDPSGMVYLRARYYMPSDGRFLTRDTWEGDYNSPLSLNRWMYVEGNPVNYTDPSGHIIEKESKRADVILENLYDNYSVYIKKDWGYRPIPYFSLLPESAQLNYVGGCYWEDGNWRSLDELEWTLQAVKDFTKAFGPQKGLFNTAMGWEPVRIHRISTEYVFEGGAWTTVGGNVLLPNNVFNSASRDVWAKGQVVHELAHVMDFRRWSRFSNEMATLTKSFKNVCVTGPRGVQSCHLAYDLAGEPAPTGYAQGNPQDDWAESFKVFVYPSMGSLRSIREDYIKDVIWDLKTP